MEKSLGAGSARGTNLCMPSDEVRKVKSGVSSEGGKLRNTYILASERPPEVFDWFLSLLAVCIILISENKNHGRSRLPLYRD